MQRKLDDLYRLHQKDLPKAGVVLADAFQNDPFWKEVFAEVPLKRRQVFFESPIRYCFRYGEAYAPSPSLEGVAAWTSSDNADVTMWRAIRCGSFRSAMKVGIKTGMHTMKIMEPLEADRKERMRGRTYLYFMIVGVASEFHGQGLGKKMFEAIIEESEHQGVPIFLETSTKRNIEMYEKVGFRVVSEVMLPIVHRPQWGMIRDCQA